MTSSPARHRSAIFDLDGTLVDTGPDLLDSLNHTIARAGLDPVQLEDLDHLVGQGARMMIARAFSLSGRTLDAGESERLLPVFLEHYADNMPGSSVPFPGLLAALDRLADAGFELAVCTNKTEALSLRLLEKLGIGERFGAIVGGDTFAYRKPDGRHVLSTIERLGGTAAQSVMIGDSVNDIKAAREAGVRSIGVPFGYSDVPIAALEPDLVVEHFDELTPGLIEALIAPRAARA